MPQRELKGLPLFPLNTVLFPGGQLSLRIFEPRYLRMIASCMKEDSPFGVCLIRSGREAGRPAAHCETGTLAVITDWHKLPDGMLGILCVGTRRCRVLSTTNDPDGLIRASAKTFKKEPAIEIPHRHHILIALLKQVTSAAGSIKPNQNQLDDADYVGFQLAEALPFDLAFKQELLECADPLDRLEEIQAAIHRTEQEPESG